MQIRDILRSEQLDRTFAALANPTRRAIIERLAENAATVNQLAEPFDMTLPAITHHIKILERAGLVERSRSAQYRPVALQPGGLTIASRWTDECRQTWEVRFSRMDKAINEIKEPKDGE
ncbi:MAG: ArsR family transcriptional regulator [Acidimicrobiales bacterium]|nr:winged helix-turn-helix transcriptional regulator [Hyphomonadaceae bacterium]RZV37781.1 MAG: ArsR family transcriptional regulator [Acidimicrobiales bacterium]